MMLTLRERFCREHIALCWRMAKQKKAARKQQALLDYAMKRRRWFDETN